MILLKAYDHESPLPHSGTGSVAMKKPTGSRTGKPDAGMSGHNEKRKRKRVGRARD